MVDRWFTRQKRGSIPIIWPISQNWMKISKIDKGMSGESRISQRVRHPNNFFRKLHGNEKELDWEGVPPWLPLTALFTKPPDCLPPYIMTSGHRSVRRFPIYIFPSALWIVLLPATAYLFTYLSEIFPLACPIDLTLCMSKMIVFHLNLICS